METIIGRTDAERVEDYQGRLADAFGRLNDLKRELDGLHDEGIDLEFDLGDEFTDELAETTCHIAVAYDAVALAWNVWDNFLPC